MRILIVEDEFLVALEIQIQLEDRGHEVVGMASTVESALRVINKTPLDLAVLDVNLQGEHVRPVASRLHDLNVPFVYTTAYAAVLTEADGAGGAPVLGKPYSADDLDVAISGLVEG